MNPSQKARCEKSISHLLDVLREYQARNPPHNMGSVGSKEEDAIESALDAAMWLSLAEGERAFRGLESVWSAIEDDARDGYVFYLLEDGLARRALAAGNIDAAAWLLVNHPQVLRGEIVRERGRLIEMLASHRALFALAKVCRMSDFSNDRFDAAFELWRILNEEAFVLLEGAMANAKGEDRERLQVTIGALREYVTERAEREEREEERRQNEASMRDFIEQVLKEANPQLEEIETCLRYLEDNPSLIGGMSHMAKREKLERKKREAEENPRHSRAEETKQDTP